VTIAKWKTAIQMVAVSCLILYEPQYPTIIVIVGYITLYIATLLTLWSMLLYLYAARRAFEE
jgi:CDP-diacylglycerol--glycerol-3-phosphate 3-phosphatidyltransferase